MPAARSPDHGPADPVDLPVQPLQPVLAAGDAAEVIEVGTRPAARPSSTGAGRNQARRRGWVRTTQASTNSAKIRSIERTTTSIAVESAGQEHPAPRDRRRDATAASSTVRNSAAGPCCQSDWLATLQRSDPSAVAMTATDGHPRQAQPHEQAVQGDRRPGRPGRRRRAWPSSGVSAWTRIGSRSQPGSSASRTMTCGAISGSATSAGPTG